MTIKITLSKNNTHCPNIMCTERHTKITRTVQILCILKGKMYTELNI